jgi:hypothetical protein
MGFLSYHSQTKDGITVQNIVSMTVEKKTDAEQISMFAKEMWEAEMMVIIKKFKTFYPSEIRLLCKILPPFDNNFGAFYRTLLENGTIRRTGRYRKSMCSSRKGGVEWEYETVQV